MLSASDKQIDWLVHATATATGRLVVAGHTSHTKIIYSRVIGKIIHSKSASQALPKMYHRPLGTHRHPASNGEAARQELDDERFDIKYVSHLRAIEEAYELGETRPSRCWADKLQTR